jgi:sugar lactone lactonase YvrE
MSINRISSRHMSYGFRSSWLILALFLVDPTVEGQQLIDTIAGTGLNGFAGDGGQASRAELGGPASIAIDASGNVYFADYFNSRVRKVTPAGIISTAATLNHHIFSIAVDSSGNLYIADTSSNVIRMMSPSGTFSIFAGTGTAGNSGDNGPATLATLQGPCCIAYDNASARLYISDAGNDRVRYVENGTIFRFAGTGIRGYNGDNILATTAELELAGPLSVDPWGNVYIIDNARIRKVNPASGFITTYAGTGTSGYYGDGLPATQAEFNSSSGLAFDARGNLYIADTGNARVRKVSSAGQMIISTVAGNGKAGNAGDGGAATSADIGAPESVALDGAGNLYVSDFSNNVIRAVYNFSPLFGTVVDAIDSNVSAYYVARDSNLYATTLANSGIRYAWISSTQITGMGGRPAVADSAANWSGLATYYNAVFGWPEVVYAAPSGTGALHVIQLSGTQLMPLDLTQTTNSQSVLPGSSIAGFADSCNTSDNIFFIGVDAHVYRVSLGFNPILHRYVWGSQDLTAATGAVLAQSGTLTAHEGAAAEEVFYFGTDNLFYRLWAWSGCSGQPTFDGWHSTDLSGAAGAGAPIAGTSLWGFYAANASEDAVFYVNANQGVQATVQSAFGRWVSEDASAAAHAPAPLAHTAFAGQTSFFGGIEAYYEDGNGYIRQLTSPPLNPTTWTTSGSVINAAPANPLAVVNSPLFFDHDPLVAADELYYLGIDSHIHVLSSVSYGPWIGADATATANATMPVP